MSTLVGILVVVVILWLITMSILLSPEGYFRSLWDKITRAKFRDDRVSLQIMLDHFVSNPQDWSISRDTAAFPKEGSKQIYLSFNDNKKHWEYTLTSFENKARPLDGHFETLFVNALNAENSQRERKSLLRGFYPELSSDQLLLK